MLWRVAPGELSQVLAARHEAAHAIAADAVGVRVRYVTANPDGSGSCEHDRVHDRGKLAMILVAPVAWSTMDREYLYDDGHGCRGDLARLLEITDRTGANAAVRRVMGVLRARRDDVVALADLLSRVGSVNFDQLDLKAARTRRLPTRSYVAGTPVDGRAGRRHVRRAEEPWFCIDCAGVLEQDVRRPWALRCGSCSQCWSVAAGGLRLEAV